MPLRVLVMVVMHGSSPPPGWTLVNRRQSRWRRRQPATPSALTGFTARLPAVGRGALCFAPWPASACSALPAPCCSSACSRRRPRCSCCLRCCPKSLANSASPPRRRASCARSPAPPAALTAVAAGVAPRRPGLRALLSAGAALVALGSALSAAAPNFVVLAAAQGAARRRHRAARRRGHRGRRRLARAHERAHVLAWAIAGMPPRGSPACRSSAPWPTSAGALAWLAVPASPRWPPSCLVASAPGGRPVAAGSRRARRLATPGGGPLRRSASCWPTRPGPAC